MCCDVLTFVLVVVAGGVMATTFYNVVCFHLDRVAEKCLTHTNSTFSACAEDAQPRGQRSCALN